MDSGAFLTSVLAAVPSVATGMGVVLARVNKKIKECHDEKRDLADRILVLEVSQSGDFPRWVRNQDGVIMSVSPEFVRVFGATHGYKRGDLIGKKFTDLGAFSRELVETLASMDVEVLTGSNYATRHGVEISPGAYATILKTTVSSPSGLVFVGVAALDRMG